jgi:hypothetical protein
VVALTAEARRIGRLVAATALCLYIATAGGNLGSSDAVFTYEVTKSLVTEGSVGVAYNVKDSELHRGLDGRFYSPFGIGQSVFNIPFFVAGRALRAWLPLRLGTPEALDKAVVAMGNTVAAAGVVWVVFLLAWRLSGDLRAAMSTALAVGFGTLLWPYAKLGFNAPLTTWCLSGGVYLAWTGVGLASTARLAGAGALIAGAFLTRHEAMLAAPVVALWIVTGRPGWRQRLTGVTWFGLPLVLALVFWCWYNAIRFGDPLNTGYADDPTVGATDSLVGGLYGLLFSPGRSLFVYTPLVVAGLVMFPALARADRGLAYLNGGLSLAFLAFYASLSSWEGGRSYGPRYLVPILPLLVLPVVFALRSAQGVGRRAVTGLVALSVIVQVPGVLVNFSAVELAYARIHHESHPRSRASSWASSGLVLNATHALSAVPENIRLVASGTGPALVAAGERDELPTRLAFSLAFWWLYLFYLGAVSAPAAVLLGAAPVAVAGWLLRHVRRRGATSPALPTASGSDPPARG